jgi:hypothetical protein
MWDDEWDEAGEKKTIFFHSETTECFVVAVFCVGIEASADG